VTPPTHPVSPPKPPPVTPKPKPGHEVGVNPGHNVHVGKPDHVVEHSSPSHLSSSYTQGNNHEAFKKLNHFNDHHPDLTHRANVYSESYREHYHERWHERWEHCHEYHHQDYYRCYYSRWWQYGFYGGYYYPVRPCEEIYTYFYYPVVMWFYIDTPEVDYYQVYYGDDYIPTQPVEPFPYARVYLPTDTLRDLAVEVSGMSYALQTNFRQAITNFTDWLADAISQNLQASFAFGDNDIVINHYENLQNQAIEIEGFVDRADIHVSFKGLLDLNDPSQTLVFVPNGDTPTDDQLNILAAINDRMTQLGATPDVAQNEPENSSGQ
jgi:hypothetical protein